MRKLIIGSLAVAALGSLSLPAAAHTNLDFVVSIGPPPVYREYLPPPRAGFVWVPGYWGWRYGRYDWIPGRWVRHRPAYHYDPIRWRHREGPYFGYSGWRDADRDGVPNRFDRRPFNPRWH